jgi:hypothetical protein
VLYLSVERYVTDLRVVQAITTTGKLTATLRWTAPTGVVTTTMRYSDTLITAVNWDSALTAYAPFTTTNPGSAKWFVTSVPYTGGTAYFALRSKNLEGDWTVLSNNAFWPEWEFFLPLVAKKHQ